MRPARFIVVILASLGSGGCTMVAAGDEEFRPGEARANAVTPEQVARERIQAGEIRRHIGYLASDEMRGRDTPSGELERVAAWIAERFAAAGLHPAGQDGGFIHFWTYEARPPVTEQPPGDRGLLTLADGDVPASASASAGSAAVPVPNVVGVLPGSDGARAGEYVILLAHFDHLGVGTPGEEGDSIYNGADDNASGTAALVAVARAFGSLEPRAARPILFLATSGGEKGLLGATAFAADPTVFLSGAVAVINMDMVGRNERGVVGVVGHDYSSLGPLLVRTAAAPHLGLTVDSDPPPGHGLFSRSDHWPFARLGIPAIVVTTGTHEDHQRPSDEADRVDADKVARIARLVFLAAYELAMGRDAEWTEEGRRALR